MAAPRANLDRDAILAATRLPAFIRYQLNNLLRLREWLQAPEASGMHPTTTAPARGAGWSFIRYAADRAGGDESGFWRALTAGPATGRANLAAAIGTDPGEWWRDWL